MIKKEPDWTALPAETPVSIRKLFRAALRRIPSAVSRTSATRASISRKRWHERRATRAEAAPGNRRDSSIAVGHRRRSCRGGGDDSRAVGAVAESAAARTPTL